MLPGPSQQFWVFPRVGQRDRDTPPSKLPKLWIKTLQGFGIWMEIPLVIAQGLGCSRFIPESKTRHIPDFQQRGSEQTLGNVQDLLSPWLESAGWSHSLDGSFPGLLPTQPAHPSSLVCLFFVFFFSPGNCSRISGSPWAHSVTRDRDSSSLSWALSGSSRWKAARIS